MGIMIFAAGAIVGMFLGIMVISLLSMADKAEKVYDLLDRREAMAGPETPLLSKAVGNYSAGR